MDDRHVGPEEPAGHRDRPPVRPDPVRGVRRVVYVVLASVLFGLGALGAVLPGLPATPFLLLSSVLLVRSSPRLNAALLGSRFFGPILRDWQQHRGVRPVVKLRAVAVVVLAVAATVLFSSLSLSVKAAVVLLAGTGIAVIYLLPEIRGD